MESLFCLEWIEWGRSDSVETLGVAPGMRGWVQGYERFGYDIAAFAATERLAVISHWLARDLIADDALDLLSMEVVILVQSNMNGLYWLYNRR